MKDTYNLLGDGIVLWRARLESGQAREGERVRIVEVAKGIGVVVLELDRLVYDEGHQHWHLLDFVAFELWSLGDEGEPMVRVATTGKISFCLADSHPVAERLPNAAEMAAVTDCEAEVQGISVGWEDVYPADLPGQELDIPDLADGVYAIRTIVDPDRHVLETDKLNNMTVQRVRIVGDHISYASTR